MELEEYGYITVSASGWQGDGKRPEFSKVTYYWPKSSQVTVVISTAASTREPEDVYMVHAAMPEGQQPAWVGMALTKDQEVVTQAMEYARRGVFLIHEKLLPWAMGGVMQAYRGSSMLTRTPSPKLFDMW